MKKILIITICSVLIFGSCNKNKKLNKSLDGTWITTSINGTPVTMADNVTQYQFSKSTAEGGNIKVTYFLNNSIVGELTGTYIVSNDGKTITIDANGTPGSQTNPTYTIHIVDAISNKTDKKFTADDTADARRGFVWGAVYVFEKQ